VQLPLHGGSKAWIEANPHHAAALPELRPAFTAPAGAPTRSRRPGSLDRHLGQTRWVVFPYQRAAKQIQQASARQ